MVEKLNIIKDKTKTHINNLTKNNNFKIYFFTILSFILLVISFTRIPYIGEFFDAVFFSFLFGWSKFIIYGYLLILIVLVWTKKIKKPLYSKRAFVLLLLTCFLLSCLFSSIQVYVHNTDKNMYIIDYLNYWKDVVFPLKTGFNPFIYQKEIYVDGGILGICISYLSNIIVMIISIVGIVAIYLLLATRHREKLFSLFKRKFKKVKIEENINLAQQQFEHQQEVSTNDETIMNDTYLQSIKNDWKKQYLTLDNKNSTNKTFDVNQLKQNILEFFNENKIEFLKSSSNDDENAFVFELLIDENAYSNFKSITNFFKMKIGDINYTMEFDNNQLLLTFQKHESFNNTLLKKNLLINYKEPFEIAFCNDDKNVPIIMDLKKNTFIGVFDQKDKNINNLIDNIIYNVAWTYKTNQVKMFYLSTKNIKLPSFTVPNFNDINLTTTNDALNFFKKILKEMNDLLKEFKKKQVDDLYAYNSLVAQPVANKVILINDLNQMCTINPTIKEYINEINKHAKVCGITLITFDKSIDAITYNNFKYPTTILFKASVDISMKLLNNKKAVDLNDHNNAILYNEEINKQFVINVPFISDNEQQVVINILKKCYLNKKF